MNYSLLSLKPPTSRLTKAASSVFNPLSAQKIAPSAAPSDYGQQIGQFMQGMAVPQFADTPNGNSTTGGGVTFTNQGSGAFGGVSAPSLPNTATGVPGTIDWQNDPIYQQAQAAVQQQISAAQAQALASEKQSLIRYGDPSLISQVLGKQADQKTLDAARDNSFSTVAELGRWNDRALGGIDSATNRNNLFFSSTRGRDRGLQEEDLIRQQTRTGNQLQDVLTGLANGLIAARSQGQMELLSAAEGAYGRALQLALMQQYAPQAGTATGGVAGAAAGAYPGTGMPPIVSGNGGGGYQSPSPFGYQPPSPYTYWWQHRPGGGF